MALRVKRQQFFEAVQHLDNHFAVWNLCMDGDAGIFIEKYLSLHVIIFLRFCLEKKHLFEAPVSLDYIPPELSILCVTNSVSSITFFKCIQITKNQSRVQSFSLIKNNLTITIK